MQALQSHDLLPSDRHAMDQLHDFLRRRRETCATVEGFEHFERQLHRIFVAAEREALGHELARFDLDMPQVDVEDERYAPVLRCETTYNSAAGPIRVECSLLGLSSENGCDSLQGVEYGLCTAYYEAMDCNGSPQASATACERVWNNFMRASGSAEPPCLQ